jgi:hypothetical protein
MPKRETQSANIGAKIGANKARMSYFSVNTASSRGSRSVAATAAAATAV